MATPYLSAARPLGSTPLPSETPEGLVLRAAAGTGKQVVYSVRQGGHRKFRVWGFTIRNTFGIPGAFWVERSRTGSRKGNKKSLH